MKCENPECKLNFKKDATYVLRLITIPKSRCQTKLLYERKCVCFECAIYLCNHSEFQWENLSSETINSELLRRKEISKIKQED